MHITDGRDSGRLKSACSFRSDEARINGAVVHSADNAQVAVVRYGGDGGKGSA